MYMFSKRATKKKKKMESVSVNLEQIDSRCCLMDDDDDSDPADHIEVSSFYQIDHSKLPPKTPQNLWFIRVVVVNEKTRMRVSLRFPSMSSLEVYFKEEDVGVKYLPELDQKHIIGAEAASEVLYRRILPSELAENRRLWCFWTVPIVSRPVSKNGALWKELMDTRMVKWGQRRQVRFLSRHEEDCDSHKAIVVREEEERKRSKSQIVVRKKKLKNKKSIKRWSMERYKMAEVNMLKIMREEGAVFGNTILRAELRAKARKLIGDTGLLDHLLKHMAGKVAPGGEERFQRRHNADGAMEYWLEKADLAVIRKEAGVEDPYWTPPHGWMPGDNPTQDPVCAKAINELRDDVAKLKKDMEELIVKKHENELAIVATPLSSLSQEMEYDSYLTAVRELYNDLINKKAKIEELLGISQSSAGTEIKSSPDSEEMDKETAENSKKTEPVEGQNELLTPGNAKEGKAKKTTEKVIKRQSDGVTEDKEAKIKRLRSGFRICKPQGTFLWPSNTVSTSPSGLSQYQLDDLLVVHTPSSVSSSTSQRRATSPVKPLAERRTLSMPLLSVTLDSISTPTSNAESCLINLNEPPQIQNDNGFYGSSSCLPVTYHRKQICNQTTKDAISLAFGASKERNEVPARSG